VNEDLVFNKVAYVAVCFVYDDENGTKPIPISKERMMKEGENEETPCRDLLIETTEYTLINHRRREYYNSISAECSHTNIMGGRAMLKYGENKILLILEMRTPVYIEEACSNIYNVICNRMGFKVIEKGTMEVDLLSRGTAQMLDLWCSAYDYDWRVEGKYRSELLGEEFVSEEDDYYYRSASSLVGDGYGRDGNGLDSSCYDCEESQINFERFLELYGIVM
jgi:hypothetical protein